MKQVIKTFLGVIIISSFILTSCNKVGNNDEILSLKKEVELLKREVDTLKLIHNLESSQEATNLNFLKKLNGKYSWDVKLFENENFKQRLSKLIGNENYSYLIEYWNVEGPMVFSGNVFIAKGCQAHNCNMTNFIIVYDFTNNVMYAGIRKEGWDKTFSEDDGVSPKVIEWRGWE